MWVDIATWDPKTGEIQVALSDGIKFTPQQKPWSTFIAPEGATVKLLTGDFNGGNKDDLLFWVQGKNTAYMMPSNGNSFSPAEPWLQNWPEGGDLTALAGNLAVVVLTALRPMIALTGREFSR